LIRKEAIKMVSKILENDLAVAANGYISRDLFEICDKPSNFYMIGSMGLASSIGLGLALKNPKKRIYVFDGDGNILMNLGSLTTIGNLKPKNLIHIVFDNSSHESTGGQPTNTTCIQIDKIAKACNYNKTYSIKTESDILTIFKKTKKINGPIMILIKIHIGGNIGKRISILPIEIKQRFMNFIN